MTNDQKQQIIEALEICLESAQSEANEYHAKMAGYQQYRHDAMDADVEKIKAAIELTKGLVCE